MCQQWRLSLRYEGWHIFMCQDFPSTILVVKKWRFGSVLPLANNMESIWAVTLLQETCGKLYIRLIMKKCLEGLFNVFSCPKGSDCVKFSSELLHFQQRPCSFHVEMAGVFCAHTEVFAFTLCASEVSGLQSFYLLIKLFFGIYHGKEASAFCVQRQPSTTSSLKLDIDVQSQHSL